jgi:hypothetical protein
VKKRDVVHRGSALAIGAHGTIVIVHRAGMLVLFCSTDRTWPVTIDPSDRQVVVLPLNCAMRKRRANFLSVVSNVTIGSPFVRAIIAFEH